MHVITSVIMAKIDNKTDFPSSNEPGNYNSIKYADTAGLILSILLVLYCGFKMYSKYKKT